MVTAGKRTQKVVVILMTYGSPKTLADVPQYLKNVYGGKNAPLETIKEFKRRYKVIGGSPLVKITKQQAAALEKELRKKKGSMSFRVVAGMRFSHPFIKDAIKKTAKNADMVVGVIMSPQYSPLIMKGYIKELREAVDALKRPHIVLKMATDWHNEPYFLQALSNRVKEALKSFPKKVQDDVPVLFSAHSMPKRVIDNEPNYITDLKETAANVAKLAGLPKKRWMFCYQSAGHTPEEWLKPDFADVMPVLAKKNMRHVLIAPVQFLADHLEILYDVNIGAREQAEACGINFKSTKSLNTSPLFITSLAQVVRQTIAKK